MPMTPTTNMLLVKPTEGGDSGSWDTELNTALDLVDAHDHSTGKGVKVKTNGLDINSDLTFTSAGTAYAAKDAKAIDFAPSAASGMTAYAGALFCNSDDSNNLYWRTTSGTNVKLTNGAALNVAAFVGGIGGDYGAIPAECNFVDASKTYTFKSTAAGNWSRLQAGALRIVEFGTTESTYVELACPSALAGTYTVTLPTAAPGSTSIVQMSSTGVLTASNTVANAATFSSLITASSGITASANQHVTVSGTGLYKHGNRTFNMDTLAAFVMAGTPTFSSADNKYTGVATIGWRIPLEAGKRITGFDIAFDRAGAGTITVSVKKRSIVAAGGGATVATFTDTTTSGYQFIQTTGLTEVMAANTSYWIEIGGTNAGNVYYAAAVTVDQP